MINSLDIIKELEENLMTFGTDKRTQNVGKVIRNTDGVIVASGISQAKMGEIVIFENGERACGCAHSYAMRGLAKYLLVNHPEMSDYEILNELGKWKVLFFPGIHEKKAQVLKANGIDTADYVNLASNLYRGAENQATTSTGSNSQMVGGC